MTLMGLANPSLPGSSGTISAFTETLAPEMVLIRSPFTGPGCSGAEPERSMVMSLPLTVTAILTGRGAAKSMPLSSRKSSAQYVPSGICSMACLIMRSL